MEALAAEIYGQGSRHMFNQWIKPNTENCTSLVSGLPEVLTTKQWLYGGLWQWLRIGNSDPNSPSKNTSKVPDLLKGVMGIWRCSCSENSSTTRRAPTESEVWQMTGASSEDCGINWHPEHMAATTNYVSRLSLIDPNGYRPSHQTLASQFSPRGLSPAGGLIPESGRDCAFLKKAVLYIGVVQLLLLWLVTYEQFALKDAMKKKQRILGQINLHIFVWKAGLGLTGSHPWKKWREKWLEKWEERLCFPYLAWCVNVKERFISDTEGLLGFVNLSSLHLFHSGRNDLLFYA